MESEGRINLDIKVLVVDDLKKRRDEVKAILSDITTKIYEAENGLEAVIAAEKLKPDIIFMDIKMPAMDGIEACKKIMETNPLPVIFLTAAVEDNYDHYIERVKSSGAFSYIVKPPKKSEVLAQTIIAIENFKRFYNIKKENEDLKKYIEDRKLIDKAKAILVEKDKISEKEALRRLQRLSMNSGVPIGDIAKAIIITSS